MTDVVSISTVGVDEKERTVLTVAANLMAAYGIKVHTLAQGDTSGQVVLVDAGTPYERLGSQVLVQVDGSRGRVPGALMCLERPLRVQGMREMLQELFDKYTNHLEAAARAPVVAPAANKPPPAANGTAAPVSNGDRAVPDSLFGAMVVAVDDAALLQYSDAGRSVCIDGRQRLIYTDLDDAALAALCSEGGSGVKIAKLDATAFTSTVALLKPRPIAALVWSAAYLRAPGKDYSGTSLHSRFKLTSWPRFPARHSRPEFMRLGAMVTRNGMSLQELHETSGVELGLVIDFFHILLILGLVEFTLIQDKPVAQEKEKPTSKRQGLFAMIAKRLSRG